MGHVDSELNVKIMFGISSHKRDFCEQKNILSRIPLGKMSMLCNICTIAHECAHRKGWFFFFENKDKYDCYRLYIFHDNFFFVSDRNVAWVFSVANSNRSIPTGVTSGVTFILTYCDYLSKFISYLVNF